MRKSMMRTWFNKSTVRPVVVCGSLLLTLSAAAPRAAALLLSSPGAYVPWNDCAAATRMTTTTTQRLFASDGTSSSSSTALSTLPRLIVKTNESGGAAVTELSTEEVAKRLAGKRVAYYFGAGWCPMCTSFDPSLLKFRQMANDSGKGQVELIYVPSDRSMSDAIKRAAALNILLMVPFGDDADAVKKEYKIWAGSESLKLGFGRRSGVPALVVLSGETGKELAFLPAEAQGVKALQAWPMEDTAGAW